MKGKFKNVIIFVSIGAAMIALYFVFIKKDPEEPSLAISGGNSAIPAVTTNTASVPTVDTELSKDFLTVLLSIQNITLDDSIFSDIAFMNLRDSTIILVPDGTEGRPNPFAPIGSEVNIPSQNPLGASAQQSLVEDDLLIGLDETIPPASSTPIKPTTPKR